MQQSDLPLANFLIVHPLLYTVRVVPAPYTMEILDESENTLPCWQENFLSHFSPCHLAHISSPSHPLTVRLVTHKTKHLTPMGPLGWG